MKSDWALMFNVNIYMYIYILVGSLTCIRQKYTLQDNLTKKLQRSNLWWVLKREHTAWFFLGLLALGTILISLKLSWVVKITALQPVLHGGGASIPSAEIQHLVFHITLSISQKSADILYPLIEIPSAKSPWPQIPSDEIHLAKIQHTND